MADAITIKALQDASLDAKSLEEVVNGNETKQVTTRLGESYPSVKKAIKTLFENGGLPATPFATKALMTASALVDGKYAQVTDDTINNGLYVKTAGAWVKSNYDPLTLAKADATTKADNALVDSKAYTDSKASGGIKSFDAALYFHPKNLNLVKSSEFVMGQTLRNGALFTQSTTVVSGYMPLTGGAEIVASQAIKGDSNYGGYAFYGDAKNVISFVHGAVAANTPIAVPVGSVWFRCAFESTTILANLGIFNTNALPAIYGSNALVDTISLASNVAKQVDEERGLVNLFDKTKARLNFYLASGNNTETANSSYFITNYITVNANDSITFSHKGYSTAGFGVTWYAKDKTHLKSANLQVVANTPITVPNGAHYLRSTFLYADVTIDKLVAVRGTELPKHYILPSAYETLNYLAPWYGKRAIHLGDSITFSGSFWINYLHGRLRSSLAANHGKNGRIMKDLVKKTDGTELTTSDFDGVDFVICKAGTNDFGGSHSSGYKIGLYTDAASQTANNFYANTRYVIEQLYTLKPSLRVIFLTPIYRSAAPEAHAANVEGKTLYDYADAVKRVCADYGVPCLDLLSEGGLNSYNSSLYLADGLHPTNDGGVEVIGKKVAAWMTSIGS